MGRPYVVLGLDLGQRRDPSALAVVEAVAEPTGRAVHVGHIAGWGTCDRCRPEMQDTFYVRSVGRLALGLRYPVIGERVAEVVFELNRRGVTPYLLADSTGVGVAGLDIVRAALVDADVLISAVTFTGGDKLRGNLGSPEISMPKAVLVSRLQALLQTGRVRMPDNSRTRALAEELARYEVRISDAAHLQAGAFGAAHDDLATALGLSVLFDPSREQVTYWPAPY
jgi:hypothetical protein